MVPDMVGLGLEPNIYKMSWDEIKELQNYKLRKYIREQLYPYSPYYRRLFDREKIDPEKIKTTDDLVHIPFTWKADIAPTLDNFTRPNEFILEHPALKELQEMDHNKRRLYYNKLTQPQKREWQALLYGYLPVHVHFTTGRTALPTPIWHTQRDVDLFVAVTSRIMSGGLVPEDPLELTFNIFPFAPHLGFWYTALYSLFNTRAIMLTGGGRSIPTDRALIIFQLVARDSVFLQGIVEYVYHFIREARERNMDMSSIRTVLLTGGRVTTELQTKLIDMLTGGGARKEDLTFLGYYTFTECGCGGGMECCHPGDFNRYGYHTVPDFDFFEVVNPKTGERVKEGEQGELVYTPLERRGSVVFRYRTGDVAVGGMVYEPCPACGSSVPRISPDIVRSSEIKEFAFSKVKGTLVNMDDLNMMLTGHPDVVEWQAVLGKERDDPFGLDTLTLYVAPCEEADWENLCRDITRRFATQMEVTPNKILKVSYEEILNRLGMEDQVKVLRIVDQRPSKVQVVG
jgi:phenylacetate-coenzyme A ligase PaaK-like adenylate-forming protein